MTIRIAPIYSLWTKIIAWSLNPAFADRSPWWSLKKGSASTETCSVNGALRRQRRPTASTGAFSVNRGLQRRRGPSASTAAFSVNRGLVSTGAFSVNGLQHQQRPAASTGAFSVNRGLQRQQRPAASTGAFSIDRGLQRRQGFAATHACSIDRCLQRRQRPTASEAHSVGRSFIAPFTATRKKHEDWQCRNGLHPALKKKKEKKKSHVTVQKLGRSCRNPSSNPLFSQLVL